MMENPLSDEEGGEWGGGAGVEHQFDLGLSPFADSKMCWVRRTPTSPPCSLRGCSWNKNESVSVCFVCFFLHCFCNKSGNSGEKDCNHFVSSYQTESKMDWMTGVWFF